MMKLAFYYGPGDMVTRTIRFVTRGPYSHVELQFTDGCRFFSSGHGIYTGTHMINDRKIYDHWWDQVLIPATHEQEKEAEKFIFELIGTPFDWRGMAGFLIPFLNWNRKPRYCSSVIMDVLQQSLHLFPGRGLKISPNGLYRLFIEMHPLIISGALSEHVAADPVSPVDPTVSLALDRLPASPAPVTMTAEIFKLSHPTEYTRVNSVEQAMAR